MRLRIEGLPAKAQQVLGAAAVIGAVVDIDLLRDASCPICPRSDVLDAIDALLPRRVFRETGNAGRVEFVHDLLREFPYGDLSAIAPPQPAPTSGRAARSRRAQGTRRLPPAVLADHFRNAEDPPKAFAYAVEAARGRHQRLRVQQRHRPLE